jgi:ribosomal protein S18 acetylase RimI-like enzyme
MTSELIRRAVAEDVPAIAAVVNGWIDATPWLPRVHAAQAIEGLVREAFPRRVVWVIGDPVAGFLSLDAGQGRIAALNCARTGAGLGKVLLDKAKEGRMVLTLSTHVPNAAAQRFYRREGFVETGRAEPELPETVPEIIMEWRA